MRSLEQMIQERISGLERDGGDIASNDQRHLDQGTDERAYWHHGYASALRDILHFLQSARGPAN